MKEKTILELIDQLTSIKDSKLTISNYCKQNGIDSKVIYDKMYKFRKYILPDNIFYEQVMNLYNSIINNDKCSTKKHKDVAEVNFERDDDGHIVYYFYKIYRKNKPLLIGKLSRDEMNIIYRLYSYYGASLTQREVSRYFPDLSLVDFRRILTAFNVYKASAPFAPHVIEEKTTDELREMQIREKENDFLRKIEEDRIRNNEKLLKKYAFENEDLKTKLANREFVIQSVLKEDCEPQPFILEEMTNSESSLIIYLSDIHVGAYNEPNGYLDIPTYNESEITRRLNKIAQYVNTQTFDQLIVCNLGDSVDSYNKETTRGGHELPTIMSNKEQSLLYIKIMLNFFSTLKNICPKLYYICIGESNHDGDWGWLNNMLLQQKLLNIGINSYVSEYPIDSFNVNDVSITYLHGKDIKNQFKGFPLTLDNKTEDWFLNYFLDSKKVYKNKKCVIKGDLHQYAITCGKSFDYISAPSLYGSSNYIVANFGLTRWGCLVMEIDNENNIKNTIIKD